MAERRRAERGSATAEGRERASSLNLESASLRDGGGRGDCMLAIHPHPKNQTLSSWGLLLARSTQIGKIFQIGLLDWLYSAGAILRMRRRYTSAKIHSAGAILTHSAGAIRRWSGAILRSRRTYSTGAMLRRRHKRRPRRPRGRRPASQDRRTTLQEHRHPTKPSRRFFAPLR